MLVVAGVKTILAGTAGFLKLHADRFFAIAPHFLPLRNVRPITQHQHQATPAAGEFNEFLGLLRGGALNIAERYRIVLGQIDRK